MQTTTPTSERLVMLLWDSRAATRAGSSQCCAIKQWLLHLFFKTKNHIYFHIYLHLLQATFLFIFLFFYTRLGSTEETVKAGGVTHPMERQLWHRLVRKRVSRQRQSWGLQWKRGQQFAHAQVHSSAKNGDSWNSVPCSSERKWNASGQRL